MGFVYPADADMMEEVNRSGNADFLFTLTECQVLLPQQWRLISLGYTSLRRFSGIEDTRQAVRAAMVIDLALDPTAAGVPGQSARLALSAIITAWEASKERLSKETHLRVEAKVLGVPRQIDMVDRTAMKRAVELLYGRIPTHETPSSDYLSHKMEQLEDNDPSASPLDEVSSMADADLSATVQGWDNSGRSQLFRKRAKGSLPLTPEAFRTRLRVERNTWLYLSTKFVNRPYLAGMTPAIWEEWTDYFLGSKVYLLEIMHADGNKSSLNPPWNIILSYELECRKKALVKVAEDGLTFAAAMMEVIKDPELKELAFTSPITLSSRSAGKSSSSGHNNLENPNWPLKKRQGPYSGKGKVGGNPKGSGGKKGGGGAKGTGKGKGKKGGLAKGTPDGRQICFAYNSAAGCPTPCPFERLHVCRNWGCFGPHPVTECTRTVGA
jgi:hypothetical protein